MQKLILLCGSILLLTSCNDKKSQLKQLITSDAMKTSIIQESINERSEIIREYQNGDDATKAKFRYDTLLSAQQIQQQQLANLKKTLDSLTVEVNKN